MGRSLPVIAQGFPISKIIKVNVALLGNNLLHLFT